MSGNHHPVLNPGKHAVAAVLLFLTLSANSNAGCENRREVKQAFFGDLHVHTSLSLDANILGIRTTPDQAYEFAQGASLGIQPFDESGLALRTVSLSRPLDFAMVSDHAESLGEVQICQTPGMLGYDSQTCKLQRRWPLLAYYLANSFYFTQSEPKRYTFCGEDGERCRDAALTPWRTIQNAAAKHNKPCEFTTFIGYEWSAVPGGSMIHRNVMFKNDTVPKLPSSYIESKTAQQLWDALDAECLNAANDCDVLTIPHNSNLSSGLLFSTINDDGEAYDQAMAERRRRFEPIVEVIQHKGNSECRLGNSDELCGFEYLPFEKMEQAAFSWLATEIPQNSFVREALAEGLRQKQTINSNPFEYGLIGSTDTHLGTPGLVEENSFVGHAAGGDTSRVEIPALADRPIMNPGGLAVIWAEENTREALFAAIRKREVYATSGTRIRVRFFGGDIPVDICQSSELAQLGQEHGVPMGSKLPTDAIPRFAVSALADIGTIETPGNNLQKIQLIKLSLKNGKTEEEVIDIISAGGPMAKLDTRSCQALKSGFKQMCGIWQDPSFDPRQPALYYARVIEMPSCRWNTYACNAAEVDCSNPQQLPSELRSCCDDTPKSIQERAWTSPIWYYPPG